MELKRLKLRHFRNYVKLDLECPDQINIFVGQNAQGKTNLIESISLLSSARSFRPSKEHYFLMHGRDFFEIEAQGLPQFTLSYTYEKKASSHFEKTFEHNGLPLKRIYELYGLMPTVTFTPEDLLMIKQGPQMRRNWMDFILAQTEPHYLEHLRRFRFLLKKRNDFIKSLKAKKHANTDDLEANYLEKEWLSWTRHFCIYAAKIIKERQLLIESIQEDLKKALQTISDQKDAIEVIYQTFTSINADEKIEDLAQKLFLYLKAHRQQEENLGYSLNGPQKDDLHILINEYEARHFASQGQQRSIVLALKIAELKYIEKKTEKRPIFLLDDVLSELDPKRRIALLQSIKDFQVFLTCTDIEQFSSDWKKLDIWRNTGIFEIDHGKIRIIQSDSGAQILEQVESDEAQNQELQKMSEDLKRERKRSEKEKRKEEAAQEEVDQEKLDQEESMGKTSTAKELIFEDFVTEDGLPEESENEDLL